MILTLAWRVSYSVWFDKESGRAASRRSLGRGGWSRLRRPKRGRLVCLKRDASGARLGHYETAKETLVTNRSTTESTHDLVGSGGGGRLPWTLGLLALVAAPAIAQTILPSCQAICEMETRCRTISAISDVERVPFCLKACTSPFFDPDFHDCLKAATACEAFSACVQSFTRDRPLAPETPAPQVLAQDATLPTTSCPNVLRDCTYPQVCCTQIFSGGGRATKVHLCGQLDCPEPKCLLGAAPWCPWCSCPRTSDVYPGWPPAPAKGQGLAAFGSSLVLGYEGDDTLKRLFVTSSINGRSFANTTAIPNQNSDRGPGLAAFGEQLVMAYKAADVSNNVWVTFSSNGIDFTDPVQIPGAQSPDPPAIAVYAGKLRVAYKANDSSNGLWITSSADGRNWTRPQQVPGQQSLGKPALAVFDGQLFMAYRANDASNALYVTRTTDLADWPKVKLDQQSDRAPALAEFNGRLFMAYKANDSSNTLFVTSSADGVSFDRTERTDQQTPEPPALASFRGQIYLSYRANDSSNGLWITSSSDGKTWRGATPLTGQTSP